MSIYGLPEADPLEHANHVCVHWKDVSVEGHHHDDKCGLRGAAGKACEEREKFFVRHLCGNATARVLFLADELRSGLEHRRSPHAEAAWASCGVKILQACCRSAGRSGRNLQDVASALARCL